MKKQIAVALISSAFMATAAWGQDSMDDLLGTSQQEWQGAGIGGVLGGIAAGPPGIVAGLAFGALFGRHEALEDAVETQQSELQHSQQQLAESQQSLENSEYRMRQAEGEQLKLQQQLQRHREIRGNRLQASAEGFALNIHFRTESAELEPLYQQQLVQLASSLRAFPELNIHIDAHADLRGIDTFNQSLTEQRTAVVQQQLMGQGIPAARIVTVAHGERAADYPLEDLEGLGFDRRVRLYFSLGDV